MGGALAIDAALLHPSRVDGIVLIGAAVSGITDEDTPFDWEPDRASASLMERADDPGVDRDAKIAALAHLWLDGPAQVEGRVGGTPRELLAAMNERILAIDAPDAPDAPDAAGDAGVDAWTWLGELSMPVVCTWGELDIPADLPFYEEAARRVAQAPGRVLSGVAHLPSLERPDLVAELVRDALRS